MATANLVLEYLRVLIWPLLVILLLMRFRRQLDTLVDRITSESENLEAFGWKTKLPLRRGTVEEQAAELQAEIDEISEVDAGSEPATAGAQSRTASRMRAEILNQYILSEELVIRILERRWDQSIQREATFDLQGGTVRFDGAAEFDDRLELVEIKMLTSKVLPQRVIDHELHKAVQLGKALSKPVSLKLVIVSTLTPDELREVAERAREIVDLSPVSATVETFGFSDLMANLLGTRRDN